MSEFDKECPRCHGKGLGVPSVPPPQVIPNHQAPTPPTTTVSPQAARLTLNLLKWSFFGFFIVCCGFPMGFAAIANLFPAKTNSPTSYVVPDSVSSKASYTIFERYQGEQAKMVRVQVPAPSTKAQFEAWVSEISTYEKVPGKDLSITFFSVPDAKTSNMVASYISGELTMYNLTEAERQELIKEGD